MPRLGQRKEKTGKSICDQIGIGILSHYIPDALINKTLEEAGAQGERRRDLPPDLVVKFTLAMSLFPNDGYRDTLQNIIPAKEKDVKLPSTAAITKARNRVGAKPFRDLFLASAKRIAVADKTPNAFYKNWRLCSFDGSTFDVPSSDENIKTFGKPSSKTGQSAWPQVRVLSLVEIATHATIAASFGGVKEDKGKSEKSLLEEVIPSMKAGDLYFADRLFFGHDIWKKCIATGADMCWRIKTNVCTKAQEVLSDGSYIAKLQDPNSKSDFIAVRIIEYKLDDSEEIYRLVTTILDPDEAPAQDLAHLYTTRWESEGYYDEIKNHLHDKRPVLRSSSPERIEQEIWSMLIVHNAIRSTMHMAAIANDYDQSRLSFTNTVKIIRRETTRRSSFSPSDD